MTRRAVNRKSDIFYYTVIPQDNETAPIAVIKKLLIGKEGAFLHKINELKLVQISRKTNSPDAFKLRGGEIAREATTTLMDKLTLQARKIAKDENLQTVKDVKSKHWYQLEHHFNNFLEEARTEILVGMSAKAVIEQTARKAERDQHALSDVFDASVGANGVKKPNPQKTIPLKTKYEPLNLNQAISYVALKDPATHLVVMAGDAGGGKTRTALQYGAEAVNEGLYDKILLFRPRTVTDKNDFGALGGGMKAKMSPYIMALNSNMIDMTGKPLDHFEKMGVIDASTPDFERGASHHRAIIIVDEAQNLTNAQTKLLVTRIAGGSKIILTGDISGDQNDMRGEIPGLAHLINYLGENLAHDPVLKRGTAFIRFTSDDSSARHPFLPHLLNAEKNLSTEYRSLMEDFEAARRDGALKKSVRAITTYAEKMLETAALETAQRYETAARKVFPKFFQQPTGNVVRLPSRQIS